MSRHERRDMIDRGQHELSAVQPAVSCLTISWSSAYWISPAQADVAVFELTGLVDKQNLLTPSLGLEDRRRPSGSAVRPTRSTGRRVQRLLLTDVASYGHLPPTGDHHAGFLSQAGGLPAQRTLRYRICG